MQNKKNVFVIYIYERFLLIFPYSKFFQGGLLEFYKLEENITVIYVNYCPQK